MAGYSMPIFSKGSLLSQDMLEALKEYGLQVTQNYFAGYTDGIIAGAENPCSIYNRFFSLFDRYRFTLCNKNGAFWIERGKSMYPEQRKDILFPL